MGTQIFLYFLIIIFVSSNADAKDQLVSPSFSPHTAVFSHFKEREIKGQLAQSQELKDCQDKAKVKYPDQNDMISKGYAEISSCFKEQIDRLPKEKLKQLEESLGLKKFGLIKSKESEKIGEYFSKLIQEAFLLNVANDTKGKQLNYLNHQQVNQIYHQMMTQQFFNELSSYCLKDSQTKEQYKITKSSNDEMLKMEDILQLDPTQVNKFFSECLVEVNEACGKKGTTNQNHAGCAFNSRMRDYKKITKHLEKANKDFTQWAAENPNTTIWQFAVQNSSKAGQISQDKIDKLTKISSTQFVDEMHGERQNALTKTATNFDEKCGPQGSDKDCEMLIEKGSQESLGELMMNQELQYLAREKLLDETKGADELKKMLEDESITSIIGKDKLEELKNSNDAGKIKEFLQEHLVQSKLAIKEMIKKRLETIGLSKNDQIRTATQKIQNISKELKDRPGEYSAIVFFANVISSIPTYIKGGQKHTDNFNTELASWKNDTTLQSKYGGVGLKWLTDYAAAEHGRAPASSGSEDSGVIDDEGLDSFTLDKKQDANAAPSN
ncbi:MAG: hypothetical protein QE271_07240 [Bacteriovoracaceae bacterium]|nr:hypothetical protein [Bacteriovoracaceae bacterium]